MCSCSMAICCKEAGVIILLPFINIPSVTDVSSQNDQNCCILSLTSVLVYGHSFIMYAASVFTLSLALIVYLICLLSYIAKCLCMFQPHWCSHSYLPFLHLCLHCGCAWVIGWMCRVIALAFIELSSTTGLYIEGSAVIPHLFLNMATNAWNLL